MVKTNISCLDVFNRLKNDPLRKISSTIHFSSSSQLYLEKPAPVSVDDVSTNLTGSKNDLDGNDEKTPEFIEIHVSDSSSPYQRSNSEESGVLEYDEGRM